MEDNAANEAIVTHTIQPDRPVTNDSRNAPILPRPINGEDRLQEEQIQTVNFGEEEVARGSVTSLGGSFEDANRDISRLPSMDPSSPETTVSFIVDMDPGGEPREHQTLRKQSSVSFAVPNGLQLELEDDHKANEYYEHTSPKDLVEGGRAHRRWIDNKEACGFFVSLLSITYLFFIVIVAAIIEISPIWTHRLWVGEMYPNGMVELSESAFYLYMYGSGFFFFIYVYIFMLHPGWFNYLQRTLHKFGILKHESKWMLEKASHTGDAAAGSFYLRLGALFFGCFSIILYGVEIFLRFKTPSHHRSGQIAELVLQVLFAFAQMHFIFCNTKMVVSSSEIICKFGFIHSVALNVFTWLRFVIVKAKSKANKKKTSDVDESSLSSEETMLDDAMGDPLTEAVTTVLADYMDMTNVTEVDTTSLADLPKILSEGYFGDVTTFLITCAVEYSVIGGVVMFVIWYSIGGHHDAHSFQRVRVKRKSKMRIDCSSSSTGLFAGIIFAIMAFVSIGIHVVFDKLHNTTATGIVFGVIDLFMFITCILACVAGFWRMRNLQYRTTHHHHSGEVLDEVLLVIGLLGELVYSIIVIDLWISTRGKPERMEAYELVIYLFRTIEVLVQFVFILGVSRLRSLSPEAQKYKPGKQYVTFLMMANIALFFFHTFEGVKVNIPYYSSSPSFPYIIYGIAPLVVFYRFHSSVVLAEVWKHAYTTKQHGDGTSTTGSVTTGISGTTSHTNYSYSSHNTADH